MKKVQSSVRRRDAVAIAGAGGLPETDNVFDISHIGRYFEQHGA